MKLLSLLRRVDTLKSHVERLVEARPVGLGHEPRLPRYFDPSDVMPLLDEWKILRDCLCSDPEFAGLPQREIPNPSKIADSSGRGYIERVYLERLLNDVSYARDLLIHPSRGDEGSDVGLDVGVGPGKMPLFSDETNASGDAVQTNQPDSREVFVVYGRDTARKEFFFDFLRRIGLRPLEFETLIARTGVGAPYIGDVVRCAFEQAAAVMVLFTGDDLAHLRREFVRETDSAEERTSTPQPRANVIFEAGMALGLQRARTIIVEVPPLRGLSDLHGLHVVRFSSGTPSERNSLVTRLKTSGCEVDVSGSDWLKLEFPA